MINEKEASELLVKAIEKEKLSTFEYLKYLANSSAESLLHSGYRNGNADAVLTAIKRAEAKIEKMIQKHEREYPD